MTYQLLIDFPTNEDNHLGVAMGRHQALYRLDPPLEGHALVVVSAITQRTPVYPTNVSFFELVRQSRSTNLTFEDIPETYIFPGNEAGEILDFGELEGSQRGTLSHQKVLNDLGYQEFIPRILTLEEETRPRFLADV